MPLALCLTIVVPLQNVVYTGSVEVYVSTVGACVVDFCCVVWSVVCSDKESVPPQGG